MSLLLVAAALLAQEQAPAPASAVNCDAVRVEMQALSAEMSSLTTQMHAGDATAMQSLQRQMTATSITGMIPIPVPFVGSLLGGVSSAAARGGGPTAEDRERQRALQQQIAERAPQP